MFIAGAQGAAISRSPFGSVGSLETAVPLTVPRH